MFFFLGYSYSIQSSSFSTLLLCFWFSSANCRFYAFSSLSVIPIRFTKKKQHKLSSWAQNVYANIYCKKERMIKITITKRENTVKQQHKYSMRTLDHQNKKKICVEMCVNIGFHFAVCCCRNVHFVLIRLYCFHELQKTSEYNNNHNKIRKS